MDSEGGGVATATTPGRLTSQHSTLLETFLATDLAESLNNPNNPSNPQPISSLTLGAVLNSTKKSPPPTNVMARTLLEIIHQEETLNGGSSTSSYFGGKKSWKSFKDRLKLKRASAPDLRSMREEPINTIPSDELSMRIGARVSFSLSAALQAEREETRRILQTEMSDVNVSQNNGSNGGEHASENQLLRMSLIDLLEETEYESRVRGPIYRFNDNVEYEEEEEKVEKEEHLCCVCMVRHKGAAFIPCGHTFCRKCCRELWVQRGNCPLCNDFILDILDIF